MEKIEESSANDDDGVFCEPKTPLMQQCDQERPKRKERRVSSVSPTNRFDLLRLSSTDSDDCLFIEGSSPSQHARRFPPFNKNRCDGDAKINRDQTRVERESSKTSKMTDKVIPGGNIQDANEDERPVKHNPEGKQTNTPREQDSSCKVKKQILLERQEQSNVVQKPVGIPSSSHLALRRKRERQASTPLPGGTREDTTRDAIPTHRVLLSRTSAPPNHDTCPLPPKSPKIVPVSATRKINQCATNTPKKEIVPESQEPRNAVQLPVVIPPSSHLALRRKLKRQASIPLLGDTTQPVLLSRPSAPPNRPLPLKTPAMNPKPARDHVPRDHVPRDHVPRTTHPVLFSKPSAPPNHPLPPKSPRIAPMSATRKINQSTGAARTPRSAAVHGKQLVYPEDSRVPRTPTRETRARRMLRTAGEGQQKERRPSEKRGETSQERKGSSSFHPQVNPPRQQKLSRDCTEAWAVGPQGPRRSPRSHATGHSTLSHQTSGEQNVRRALVVGKVLVGKTKDGRRVILPPGIPVERLKNKGFFLVPDVERKRSTISRPLSERCAQSPDPKAQTKQTARKIRSLGATDSVSSRQEGENLPESTQPRAGHHKGPQGEKN